MTVRIEGLEDYSQLVSQEDDTPPNATRIRFEVKSTFQPFESAQSGREIYKSEVWIYKTMELGRNTVERPIHDKVELVNGVWKVRLIGTPKSDIKTYPEEWNAFARGTTSDVSGTPIDVLFRSDPARAAHYKYYHVHTIDQLSVLSDGACHELGLGAAEDRLRAQAYINTAKKNAPLSEMQTHLERERAERAQLERQVADLTAKLTQLLTENTKEEESAPKKRGRPRKDNYEQEETTQAV